MATITPNHAAQMRETFVSVTAAHRIAFKDHEGFHQDVTIPTGPATDAAIEYASLSRAQEIKTAAVAATNALLARVFNASRA